MIRAAALAVGLLITTPGSPRAPGTPAPGAVPPSAERPHIVLLAPPEGPMPADSASARAFVTGLRDAFEPDLYLTESVTGGPPRVSMALGNRFRLVVGEPFGDEWRTRVAIEAWLPPEPGAPDTLRGLRVLVTVAPPEGAPGGPAPESLRAELRIDLPDRPREAWFSHAGRSAGLVLVDALHHRSRDLPADTRVRIDRTIRRPAAAPAPAAPRR